MLTNGKELEIQRLESELRWLESRTKKNGTKIYYTKVKIQRLKDTAPPKPRSKPSPRRVQREKPVLPYTAKPCPENRAYVLSGEVYDLTQAMVALERLRR